MAKKRRGTLYTFVLDGFSFLALWLHIVWPGRYAPLFSRSLFWKKLNNYNDCWGTSAWTAHQQSLWDEEYPELSD